MARTLVIAYGNPLREDDGVAWEAARRLSADDPTVEVVLTQELLPELAAPLAEARQVVFVDAADGGTPGRIRCRRLRPRDVPPSLVHALDPRALLFYAWRLYGRAPDAALVSVAGEHFGFGTGLSPAVRHAVPEVVARLKRLLGQPRLASGARARGRR